ncbi:hypothetical protein CDIK_2183 [Cucumispora dikerogammari]|nr:hypothetical protein CDIK_2183 [Cucumispora dikerogammari]
MFLILTHLISFAYSRQQINRSANTKQKTLKPFNRQRDYLEKAEKDIIKQMLLIPFDNLNSCISAIQNERNNFQKNFFVVAEKLIEEQEFFKNKNIKSILTNEKSFQSIIEMSNSSDYMDLQHELRVLFFTKLITHCNKLFTNTRHMISKASAPGCPLNYDNINELFENIFFLYQSNKRHKKYNQKLTNENFLAKFTNPLLTFRYFVVLLETIFCKKKTVSRKALRNCLYGPELFNIWDRNYIDGLYYTFGYFLQYYELELQPINQEHFMHILKKTCGTGSEIIKIGPILFDTVKNFYTRYLTINITEEYITDLDIIKFPWLESLMNDIKALKECCLKDDTNLVTLLCDKGKHQDMINNIRQEYCHGMPYVFSSQSSFYYDQMISLVNVRYVYYRSLCLLNTRSRGSIK